MSKLNGFLPIMFAIGAIPFSLGVAWFVIGVPVLNILNVPLVVIHYLVLS
ncbi:MAG: hypothetical protein GXZ03_11110 [Proteiniphilum sp.]|nr:hypothetical protein [Proteiniphilum sp.]